MTVRFCDAIIQCQNSRMPYVSEKNCSNGHTTNILAQTSNVAVLADGLSGYAVQRHYRENGCVQFPNVEAILGLPMFDLKGAAKHKHTNVMQSGFATFPSPFPSQEHSLHQSPDPYSPEVFKQNIQLVQAHVERLQTLARSALTGVSEPIFLRR